MKQTIQFASFVAGIALSLTAATADTPLNLNTATPPYVPFDQTTPPGVYGHLVTAGRPVVIPQQPVRIVTPGPAEVTVYGTSQPGGLTVASDDVFGVDVGRVYRLKVTGLTDLPGVAVYPTIELVDRLHPPEGRAAEFPVLIEITADEIEAALTDRLVTKVIYVRPRNDAPSSTVATQLPTASVNANENVVKAAMQRGRPIAVLRIGGRTPQSATDADFFVGGAIEYPVNR